MSAPLARVHPDVLALIEPRLAELRAAVRAAGDGPVACVVVAPDRDVFEVLDRLGSAVRHARDGGFYAVAPLAQVRALAEELAAPVAHHLAEPVGPGEAWCLVLAARGVAARVVGWASVASATLPPGSGAN